MLEGIRAVSNTVSVTLGPKGRTVLLDRASSAPLSTKDGVRVAQEIQLADRHQNMGAQLLKEVANKVNKEAGDGTTTSLLLASQMCEEGFKLVQAGVDPSCLMRGMGWSTMQVCRELDRMAIPCHTEEQIRQVAHVASNGDKEVSSLVAEALYSVGRDGKIVVESSPGMQSGVSLKEGFELEGGSFSESHMGSAHAVHVDHPLILISTNRTLYTRDAMASMEIAHANARPLLMVAPDFDVDLLSNVAINREKGTLTAYVIRASGHGNQRAEILKDMAAICGATVMDSSIGLPPKDIQLSQLGTAEGAEVTRGKLTIWDGDGSDRSLLDRVAQIKAQIRHAVSDHDIDQAELRKANLLGSVAVLRIGTPTESALKERRARVEDALCASRAALRHGVVPGGGVALLRAQGALQGVLADGDLRYGVDILTRACEAPIRALLENAGVEPAPILDHIRKLPQNMGWDVDSGLYCDMQASGIVDPLLSVKLALQQAAVVAGIFLMTECTITRKETPHGHDP